MSELKYGTIILDNSTVKTNLFSSLGDAIGWEYKQNVPVNIVDKLRGQGEYLKVSNLNEYPQIGSVGGGVGIGDSKGNGGLECYYFIYNGSSREGMHYVRYVINEETDDWIISITSGKKYCNDGDSNTVYSVIIGTTLQDGQKVIFAPDSTMLYVGDDGKLTKSDYKALYYNIGSNYSSAITRQISLVDFCAVNVKTGELISIPRFRYATLYNGKYEVEKFEEVGTGDIYALVPGPSVNSVAICLKEVKYYDVD